MTYKLNRELILLLLKLAKRLDKKCPLWFNCSLSPKRGDHWTCCICQKDFVFEKSFLEIDDHGYQHLKDSNLLPFI